MTEMNQVESAVREILLAIGEDPDREGLRATPERVRRMYGEIFGGYAMDLETVVHGAVFNETSGGMVVVRDISFTACANIICCRSSGRLTPLTSRTDA